MLLPRRHQCHPLLQPALQQLLRILLERSTGRVAFILAGNKVPNTTWSSSREAVYLLTSRGLEVGDATGRRPRRECPLGSVRRAVPGPVPAPGRGPERHAVSVGPGLGAAPQERRAHGRGPARR